VSDVGLFELLTGSSIGMTFSEVSKFLSHPESPRVNRLKVVAVN
jgi:hypothetical protein